MDQCSNSTEMLHSMPGTILIWVAVRSHPSCATSSVLASEGRWSTSAPSSLQTTRGFVKYKHLQQLPLCPMRLPIKACCLLPATRGAAATPLRTRALPSELILVYSSSSTCFLLRMEQTTGTEPGI